MQDVNPMMLLETRSDSTTYRGFLGRIGTGNGLLLKLLRAAKTLKAAHPLIEMSTLTAHGIQADPTGGQRTM